MTRTYSLALKQQMVARLTGVNAVSAAQLARETGIRQQNLSRWLCEARNSPFGSQDNGSIPAWTVEQKARIIVQAAELTRDELTAYLQRQGVKLGDSRGWRRALEEAGEEPVSIRKQICELERQLIRKERALAEVATLLVLRETIESHRNEEDGIDERAEEARQAGEVKRAVTSAPCSLQTDSQIRRNSTRWPQSFCFSVGDTPRS